MRKLNQGERILPSATQLIYKSIGVELKLFYDIFSQSDNIYFPLIVTQKFLCLHNFPSYKQAVTSLLSEFNFLLFSQQMFIELLGL